jgi:thiol-disulfide isomerase/thioredoxin
MRRSFIAAALALAACAHPGPAPAQPAASPRPAGALELSLKRYPAGEAWQLSSDRGAVVLLDVWATWCEPCRDALPVYASLAARYAERGVKVYAVNVDAEPSHIAAFLTETKVSLPVLLDPEGVVAESQLKVQLMPTSFLIDRAGAIRHTHEGFDPDVLAGLPAEVDALLAEPGAR